MDINKLRASLVRVRGPRNVGPDASVIIPVNAAGDLSTVYCLLGDVSRYFGKERIEVVLVINNYPAAHPPPEIDQMSALGLNVVAVPTARRPGENVVTSARVLGARAADSHFTIHFDADCRVYNPTALFDWYVSTLRSGAHLAYTHVGFHELLNLPSVRAKIFVHHVVRWVKRTLLGIPTARGSNYAIDRRVLIRLYDAGKVCDDLQIGKAVKLAGGRIFYSGRAALRVLTSGRRFRGGWIKMLKYFRYRLTVHLRALPTRSRRVSHWEGFDRFSDIRQGMPSGTQTQLWNDEVNSSRIDQTGDDSPSRK